MNDKYMKRIEVDGKVHFKTWIIFAVLLTVDPEAKIITGHISKSF